MQFLDAIQWLNDTGGTWSVGATPTICLVIVAVGAVEVAVPAGQLRADQVHAALVAAVERVRSIFSERGVSDPGRNEQQRAAPAPALPVYAEEEG